MKVASFISSGSSQLPRFSFWQLGIPMIAVIMAIPVLVIGGFVFYPPTENWAHLIDHLLGDYVFSSLLLMIGVTLGTLSIGITTAWLTSMCYFPGRGLFTWALLLPLSMPAYIIAYTYTGVLDFAGPVQSSLREITGWGYGDYWFPDVRSLEGAAIMLSLVLYPYVYMMSRAAFLEQSVCVLEVSRTLGCSPVASFFRVALPLARPAIVVGLSLALMETLADYGTVQYFGVTTFTTGIFRIWYGLGDSITAAQLSALLLLFVFALVILERWSRRSAKFHHTSNKYSAIKPYRLEGWKKWLAVIASALPIIAGFIIPALQLLYWSMVTAEESLDASFISLTLNTLMLGIATAVVAVILALILAYGKRLNSSISVRMAVRSASLGYAIPGTVIAIGVILPFAWIDNSIDAWMREYFGITTGLMLSGSLFILIFAYTVRFLSVSIQAVESGLEKIKPTMDDASRSLGLTPVGVLGKIHFPLMRGTVLTALLLVFVDVLKELPATLILRPFNFNTLAVRAYEMASDERLADAGAPALVIVLVGIIPVILLNRAISYSRAGTSKS